MSLNYSLVKSLKEKQKMLIDLLTLRLLLMNQLLLMKNNEEYVYTSETVKRFYDNKGNAHKKKMTFIEIGSLIYSSYFDLYINGTLYKRALSTKDLTDLRYVYSMLKKHNFFCL